MRSLGEVFLDRLARSSEKRTRPYRGEVMSAVQKAVEQPDRELLPGQGKDEVTTNQMRAVMKVGPNGRPVVEGAKLYAATGVLTDRGELYRRLAPISGRTVLLFSLPARDKGRG